MAEITTLNFETIEDFEKNMEDSNVLAKLSKITVGRIEMGLKENMSKVALYKIELEDIATTYTISLSKKDWVTTAQNCLSHLEKVGMIDDVIDTYQLIKQLKA